MGDGGLIPNLGQSQLNVSDTTVGRDIQSVVQLAAPTRPLMSVYRNCDEGHSIICDAVMAVVHARDGSEVCRFQRNGSGLCVAKLNSDHQPVLAGKNRQRETGPELCNTTQLLS